MGMIFTIFTETVEGGGVILSLAFLMWVCLILDVEAPTLLVKNTIDEVIRRVPDENR